MCGITGLLMFENNSLPTMAAIRKMTDAIKHRGPDQTGIRLVDRIALGFTRLSILDLEHGSQPISNEDQSLWLVFNGEIYNYQSLKRELEDLGHTFKTNTDSEVIIHLYEEYQEYCLEKLRGMFGFAIWDRRKKQLFAARDHFGIKPFYYYTDNTQFAFGSEIKSILSLDGLKPAVNPKSLFHYLTLQYVPQPDTMFAGIKKLEPGHYLIVDQWGNIKNQTYWEPQFEPEHRPIETFIEEIRYKLNESVNLHTQSDVPIGSFLSGGIDSTSIASYLSKRGPIKTFSVGFEGEHNENIYAKKTAIELGIDHFDEVISVDRFFEDTIKAVWHMDEPIADPSAIAIYRLSQVAREHITVALSGEGADELFGGYRIYREPSSLKPLSWIPTNLKRNIKQFIDGIPFNFHGKNYIKRGLTPLEERFLGNAKIFNQQEKRLVLSSMVNLQANWEPTTALTSKIYETSRDLDDISRMQLIDLNFWLPGDILMKADKMSMAHSLEVRVPFLDKEVFEIARKIPSSYRVTNKTTKYVLRKAMEDIVPNHVLNRPKLGFPVPLKKWLMGSIGDIMIEQIIISGIEEWIQIDHVVGLLKEHRNGRVDNSRKIWTIYIFALWHSVFIHENSVRLVI